MKNGKGDTNTDFTDVFKILKKYHEHLYYKNLTI